MDLIALCLVLFVVFLSCCLAIIFLSDCDILTFVAEQFGRDPAKEFSEKVIWITGASSGIGEYLAKSLYKMNTKIVISARRKDELERVKKECLASRQQNESDANNILVLPLDMTELTSHEDCFRKVISHFGKLDLLISNAGRSQRARWQMIDIQVDKELFELNVFSLVNLNRIVLRYFLEIGGGHLAVVSSMAGVLAPPFSAAYTASKYAIHGYFNSLRNEIRTRNIDVTLLCPGPTFSGFLSEAYTEKVGEKFGVPMQATDKRMTTARCAQLILIALANRLEESWNSPHTFIPLAYLQAYLPYLSAKLAVYLGKSGFYMKARDTQQTINK